MINHCPKCQSENIYQDGNLWICPECQNEWTETENTKEHEDNENKNTTLQTKDSNGTILNSGDSVIVIKDLKLNGSSSTIKSGTKVKSIRVIEPENGHNLSGKIDGMGTILLKSEFVRKS